MDYNINESISKYERGSAAAYSINSTPARPLVIPHI